MRILTYLLPLIIIIAIFSGCKKGEDDPAISLRSRKARVVGEWTVISGTSFSHFLSGNYSSTSNTNFTETNYSIEQTIINNNVTNINTLSGAYSYKIIFGKDGSYSATRIIDGSTNTSSGTWNFTGSVGKLKQKEQIVLNIASESNLSTNIIYGGNITRATFDIMELRNKKMVLYIENSVEINGQITEIKEKYIFEQ